MTTIRLPNAIDVKKLSRVEIRLLYSLWKFFLKYPAPNIEKRRFIKALVWAYKLHSNHNNDGKRRPRKSGESYFIHDLRTAIRALIAGADLSMATILLVHEFVEDDDWTFPTMLRIFGQEIADVVFYGSKPPAGFPTPLDRLKEYVRLLREAIKRGGYFWKIEFYKIVDVCDNSHDTSGLEQTDIDQLFFKVEQMYLPLLRDFLECIPPTLLPFCRLMLFEIEYAVDNYNQKIINQQKVPD